MTTGRLLLLLLLVVSSQSVFSQPTTDDDDDDETCRRSGDAVSLSELKTDIQTLLNNQLSLMNQLGKYSYYQKKMKLNLCHRKTLPDVKICFILRIKQASDLCYAKL